jgi:PEGA domain
MRPINSVLIKTILILTAVSLGAAAGLAAGPRGGQYGSRGFAHARFFPSYGFGYYPMFNIPPSTPVAPRPYMPNGWWASPYPPEDPRQAGYNPRAGYRWEDVTTLILATYPKKAEITLDGSPIGSAEDLGPIQLPYGDHTLRVEAAGFEPSETVLKISASSVRQLQINLKAAAAASN